MQVSGIWYSVLHKNYFRNKPMIYMMKNCISASHTKLVGKKKHNLILEYFRSGKSVNFMYYTPFNQYKQSQPSLFSDIYVKTYVTKMKFKTNVPMTLRFWQQSQCDTVQSDHAVHHQAYAWRWRQQVSLKCLHIATDYMTSHTRKQQSL